MRSEHAATAERLRGNHVLLRAGTLRLLLPQQDVGPALHVEASPTGAARRHLACRIGDGATPMTWDEMRVLIGADLALHRIAPALLAPASPVQQFAIVDGDIAFACDARALSAFALGGA